MTHATDREQLRNGMRDKNDEPLKGVPQSEEFIMVQKFTTFIVRVSRNESFRKGVAAAGAGTFMAVISSLIWSDS